MKRWDIGSVYKEVRKSKGITQKEVCEGGISRSILSKFENNQSIPSYETMEIFLNQIDMSFDEFEYICNYYQPSEKTELVLKIVNNLSLIGTKEIKELYKKCIEFLKKHPNDIQIKNLSNILKISIELRENGFSDYSHQIASEIWKELEKRDAWYMSDLRLLASILFHFSIDVVQTITEKILENLEKYRDYKELDSLRFALLFNLGSIYLYHDLPDDCCYITKLALALARSLKRYDQLGIAQVRIGICTHDEELIQKGLHLLEVIEESRLYENLTEEVRHFHRSDF